MAAKRQQDWSAEEKLQIVIDTAHVSEEDLGAFLRRQGLHEAQLKEWRRLVLSGLGKQPTSAAKASTAQGRRVRELERELTREEKALAETAALLVLKKKPARSGGTRTTAPTRRAAADHEAHR